MSAASRRRIDRSRKDAGRCVLVAAGCTLTMPVADLFWADRYGQLKDPYGHRWSVATHTREVAPDEMQAAMKNR